MDTPSKLHKGVIKVKTDSQGHCSLLLKVKDNAEAGVWAQSLK